VTIIGKENELWKNAGFLLKAGDVGYNKYCALNGSCLTLDQTILQVTFEMCGEI
jgi:hypothetical protein